MATCASCIAVVLTGSDSSPRSRPARVAKDTGVYGGRKVVVPTWPGAAPRRADMTPTTTAPEVLPWSAPVPAVV